LLNDGLPLNGSRKIKKLPSYDTQTIEIVSLLNSKKNRITLTAVGIDGVSESKYIDILINKQDHLYSDSSLEELRDLFYTIFFYCNASICDFSII